MNAKELVEPIDQYWKRELLESLFGDESICDLRVEYPDGGSEINYELECVLRRVKVKSNQTNNP